MIRIARFLRGFRKEVILGPIFKLIEAVFELIVPLVMAQIIDVGVKNGDAGYVWRMGALMVALGFIGLACSLTCQYFAARASQGYGTVAVSYTHLDVYKRQDIGRVVSGLKEASGEIALVVGIIDGESSQLPVLTAKFGGGQGADQAAVQAP